VREVDPLPAQEIPIALGRVQWSATSRMRSFQWSLKRRWTGLNGPSGWLVRSFGMLLNTAGRPGCQERWGVSNHWHGGPATTDRTAATLRESQLTSHSNGIKEIRREG